MHEGGHVEQLHRRAGGHQALVLAVAVAAQEHEHRPQALAPSGQGARRVRTERGAVALGHLGQPRLGALEQARERRAAGREHRSKLSLGGVHRRVPAWIAMIPPAVRIQRTSLRPAAAIRAASSSGPGKRRTLLGR